MNTDTNTKRTFGLHVLAAIAFALAPGLSGCSNETTESGAEPAASSAPAEEHAHAEGEDHAHVEGKEHAHVEGEDHEHAEGEQHGHTHDGEQHAEDLSTVDGILHAIAAKHGTIESAKTDQEIIDVHHAPLEIRDLFTKLRPMLQLSPEDVVKFDGLLASIGQQADLIDKHSHEEDVQMVRTLVEKLNADIEALEKVAAPNHVH